MGHLQRSLSLYAKVKTKFSRFCSGQNTISPGFDMVEMTMGTILICLDDVRREGGREADGLKGTRTLHNQS